MLLAQLPDIAYHYAPPATGAYEDKGLYFTLNPGRADKSVGSFCVHLTGPKAGRWNDYATGDHGDIFDLIKLNLNCDMAAAMREARAMLGLNTNDPAVARQREQAAARAKDNRRRAARTAAEDAKRRAANAHRIWLSATPSIANTPAEFYLRDRRGIDLRQLGRAPGALRYMDECYYKHIDPKTGEIIQGKYPAMVAIVNNNKGEAVACHRTYLGVAKDGMWDKADLPKTKMVLGDFGGCWINLWKGTRPDGKNPKTLTACDAGTVVFMAEGIEDALTAAILLPDARHIAAISLSNLASVQLPVNVAEIVLIADQDAAPEAQAALQRAIVTHKKAGRRVRIYKNETGGKDLNDAWRETVKGQGADATSNNPELLG